MKPVVVDSLPDDPAHWIYEIKFDGYRVIALKSGGSVQLWSASHKPLVFPMVEQAVAGFPCEDAIVDGEIVALDASGRSSFQLLQNYRDAHAEASICLYVFDLLRLNGADLTRKDTDTRKARLAALLATLPKDGCIRYSAGLDGKAGDILDAVRHLGLEGIVAKRRDANYLPGARSPVWQKLKLRSEQEFVIGGYTRPEGSRKYFGSVLVGYYEAGKLQFAAKAGTGFSSAALKRYYEMFQPLRRATCPFVNLPAMREGRWGQGITPAKMRLCTWIEPKLVCQIRFAEWTTDGGLRQPVFLGLREDKDPGSVVRETAERMKDEG